VPVAAWFKKELKGLAYDTLLGKDSPTKEFFKEDYVRKLLDDHASGRRENGQRIWTLLFFDLWHRKYVRDEKVKL
jgi:asparagine synthase (glutamine-hydrolysing)